MIDALQWVATGTGVAAAIMVALHAGARFTGIGFLIFIISSVSWVAFGAAEEQAGLVVQNVVLTAINIFGVYRYLIVGRPLDWSRRKA